MNGQTDTNLQLIFLSSISIILSLFNVLLVIDGGHYNTQKPMNSVTNCLIYVSQSPQLQVLAYSVTAALELFTPYRPFVNLIIPIVCVYVSLGLQTINYWIWAQRPRAHLIVNGCINKLMMNPLCKANHVDLLSCSRQKVGNSSWTTVLSWVPQGSVLFINFLW